MGTDHVVVHVVHHVKRVAEEGVIDKGVAPHHRAHHAHVSVHFLHANQGKLLENGLFFFEKSLCSPHYMNMNMQPFLRAIRVA